MAEAGNKALQEKFKQDLETAMRFWSAEMIAMLNQQFGKDKVGHVLIIFPFDAHTSYSWISNAKRQSVIGLLRELADHIESPDARIIQPH